jgi:hypothetical protein
LLQLRAMVSGNHYSDDIRDSAFIRQDERRHIAPLRAFSDSSDKIGEPEEYPGRTPTKYPKRLSRSKSPCVKMRDRRNNPIDAITITTTTTTSMLW